MAIKSKADLKDYAPLSVNPDNTSNKQWISLSDFGYAMPRFDYAEKLITDDL
ncbi:MAG: hypothetical protein ACTHMC_28060 [Pseudobacter sp.]|uniref:hypothetical protein n=1 Tax=Pseudobacter sp. TaxID=2045420 RepID=UPI003F81AA6B